MGHPFARVQMLVAAMSAIFASAGAEEHAAALASAKNLAGSYESRGHGGKSAHRGTGIAAARRAKVARAGRAQNRRNHS